MSHGTDSEEKSSNTARETMFYVGAVFGVIGIVFLPFIIVFIALPESLFRAAGSSIQNHLPEEAKNNPAVKGSLLIFAWFGHFLWFVFVGLLAYFIYLIQVT